MLERGGFSFVALLVINPIAILLYQNCTFLPVAHSELVVREVASQKRVISSVSTATNISTKVGIDKAKVATPQSGTCQDAHSNCPLSTVE